MPARKSLSTVRPKAKRDWRNKPRKPASDKKTCSLSIRIRADDLAEVQRRAKKAGITVSDYVLACCLSD